MSKCKAHNCIRRSSFGLPGQHVKFCSAHKEEGSINLRINHCIVGGCIGSAKFNIRGRHAKFCLTHKSDVMINTMRYKICVADMCRKHAYGSRTYCTKHTIENMLINLPPLNKEYITLDTAIPDMFDLQIEPEFFD